MAKTYWAEIDEANQVLKVLVIDEENPENWLTDNLGGTWVKTFEDNSQRFNFASIGGTYDPIDDAFIPIMPNCNHDTLELNELKRWECVKCEEPLNDFINEL